MFHQHKIERKNDQLHDDQLELEQPYDDDARMADHLVEINEALKDEYWETAVNLCEEALAERPRWSEVRAARDRATLFATSAADTSADVITSPAFILAAALQRYAGSLAPKCHQSDGFGKRARKNEPPPRNLERRNRTAKRAARHSHHSTRQSAPVRWAFYNRCQW